MMFETTLDISTGVLWFLLAGSVVLLGWRYRQLLLTWIGLPLYALRIPLVVLGISLVIFSRDQVREVLFVDYRADGISGQGPTDVWQFLIRVWNHGFSPSTISILALAGALAYWSAWYFWLEYLRPPADPDAPNGVASPFATFNARRLARVVVAASLIACSYLTIVYFNFVIAVTPKQAPLMPTTWFFGYALLFSLVTGTLIALFVWASVSDDTTVERFANRYVSTFANGVREFVQLLIAHRGFTLEGFSHLGLLMLLFPGLPFVVLLWLAPPTRRFIGTAGRWLRGGPTGPGTVPAGVNGAAPERGRMPPAQLGQWPWAGWTIPIPLILLIFGGDTAAWLLSIYLSLLKASFIFVLSTILFGLLMIVVTFASPLLFVLVPLYQSFVDWGIEEQLESIAIVNTFLAAALGALCLGQYVSSRTGFPVFASLAILVFALAWFDFNDNHRIRAIDAKSRAVATSGSSSTLAAEFIEWYNARRDREKFNATEYPVYIVAARGGGIYAAYHAAYFLAALQDQNPAKVDSEGFAHHLFAISGVSGGSLGSAVFAASIAEQASHSFAKDWFEQRARVVLSQDFLSQVTAAAVFSDMPARLLPCIDLPELGTACPGRGLDRARALERVFETAWERNALSSARGFFKGSFYSTWRPKSDVPALLLNTTEVETGERVVIAPFRLPSSPSGVSTLLDRAPTLDIALSTAVGLSARFPGITPAGSYRADGERGSPKRRLVDGGYFENSGVVTALEVINRLKEDESVPKVRFILIALVGAPSDDSVGHAFGELLSPFRTLESTRSTRGRAAVEQAYIAFNGERCRGREPTCLDRGDMRVAILALRPGVALPLGWFLSERSVDAIEESIGTPSDCVEVASLSPIGASPIPKTTLDQLGNNGCLMKRVSSDLAWPGYGNR